MSVIYRQIYMTEKLRVEPINVVSDCKIPIVLELMDYDIASGALVKAYATEAYGSLTYTIDCDVDGNQISFVAPHGFFSPGYNLLQIEISGKFIPYAITVVCEYRLSDAGNAPGLKPIEPPATETTITERTIAEWGFTKNTGNYNKPANGIPETDLSPEVCEKLNAVPTIDDIPSNIVIYEETEGSEDAITVETLLLDKLTLEADDTYIYLKYGETVLGMVEAGSGGGGSGTVYCTSIVIDQNELSISLADTGDHVLSATVQPVDCTQIVKWYTSNTAVVTVDNTGKLTPVGAGTATITAKCGTQSDTMTVTVVDNSMKVYWGYYSSWSYNTPSAPLLAARSERGYSSSLSSDNLHKHTGNESDSEHARAIRIEPGCTYKLRYSGTDTNWYEGWCILSDTEKLRDNGWQNIGSSKEVTINNTYETGIYLYMSLKYGSAGTTAVTDTMLTEFISHFTMERVM